MESAIAFLAEGWAWGLAGLTVAGYALLFLLPPLPVQGSGLVAGQTMPACNLFGNLHLQGMWVAYTITAVFIVYFLGRIRKALAVHQQTLVKLDEARARGEKMTSLATLAAGAAHEFSTPLSTIAVAAAEMEELLAEGSADPGLREDAALIRAEVRRCGLMTGIELAPPADGLRWGRRVSAGCVERGVLIRQDHGERRL